MLLRIIISIIIYLNILIFKILLNKISNIENGKRVYNIYVSNYKTCRRSGLMVKVFPIQAMLLCNNCSTSVRNKA